MFEEILGRIGANLSRSNLPYMIIGGQAVLLYGEPRLTRDVDVTLGVNIDRLHDLLTVVKELSLNPIPNDVESFVKQTMVLPTIDEPTGIRVDFIFSFTPYETDAIKRARKITIMDQDVCFASPEDLIIHKIFAGRPRGSGGCVVCYPQKPRNRYPIHKELVEGIRCIPWGKGFSKNL